MYLYMCIVNPGPFHFKEAAFFGIFFTGRCYFLADLQNDQMSRSTLERKRAREAGRVGRGRSWWVELVELVPFVNYPDL
jgi:hypothetical protein